MARYIDTEKISMRLPVFAYEGDYLVYMTDVRKAIAQTPTEDVVEVVRCENCRWYAVDSNKHGFCMRPWSPSMWRDETGHLHPDDFCSYGVRKEQDNG